MLEHVLKPTRKVHPLRRLLPAHWPRLRGGPLPRPQYEHDRDRRLDWRYTVAGWVYLLAFFALYVFGGNLSFDSLRVIAHIATFGAALLIGMARNDLRRRSGSPQDESPGHSSSVEN